MSTSGEKTISCLKVLWEAPQGTSVLDLATRAGISRPAATRFVETMLAEGVLVRHPETRKVQLGLALYELAVRAVYRDFPLHIVNREIFPVAESLRRTVAFNVLEGSDVVVLSRLEWAHERVVFNPVPGRLHWASSSAGKALAAFSPDSARQRLIQSALECGGAGDIGALRDELQAIRLRGYAQVEGQWRAVGVPILNSEGLAVGALAVYLRRDEVDENQILSVVDALNLGARSIAQGLGYAAPAGAELP